MTLSSAPLSNRQFFPRSNRAATSRNSAPSGGKTMNVPKLTTRSGSLAIKRNARAGKKYNWAQVK